MKGVKSLGDRAKDVWAKWGGPITGLIDAVLDRLKLRAGNLDGAFEMEMGVKSPSVIYSTASVASYARVDSTRSSSWLTGSMSSP